MKIAGCAASTTVSTKKHACVLKAPDVVPQIRVHPQVLLKDVPNERVHRTIDVFTEEFVFKP
jgi:hypothetical protein